MGLGAALLIAGCAGTNGAIFPALFAKPADTVSFPRGQAFVVYTRVSRAATLHLYKLEVACRSKSVARQEVCGGLERAREELAQMDSDILGALANPATEVDWVAIGRAVEVVMRLASLAL